MKDMVEKKDKEEKKYYDIRSKIIVVTERILSDKSLIERKAYSEAAFFLMNDVCINKDDFFAGKLERCGYVDMYPINMKQELDYFQKENFEKIEEYRSMLTAEKIGLFTRSPGAHAVPAYDVLVQEGLQKRIDYIRNVRMDSQSEEKRCFYISELLVRDI